MMRELKLEGENWKVEGGVGRGKGKGQRAGTHKARIYF
jgi:hypothetical protein